MRKHSEQQTRPQTQAQGVHKLAQQLFKQYTADYLQKSKKSQCQTTRVCGSNCFETGYLLQCYPQYKPLQMKKAQPKLVTFQTTMSQFEKHSRKQSPSRSIYKNSKLRLNDVEDVNKQGRSLTCRTVNRYCGGVPTIASLSRHRIIQERINKQLFPLKWEDCVRIKRASLL